MRAWFTVIILVYYSCINNKLCLTKLTNNYSRNIYNYTYVLYANKLALSANDEEKFKNVFHILTIHHYICVITRKFMKILIFILI